MICPANCTAAVIACASRPITNPISSSPASATDSSIASLGIGGTAPATTGKMKNVVPSAMAILAMLGIAPELSTGAKATMPPTRKKTSMKAWICSMGTARCTSPPYLT